MPISRKKAFLKPFLMLVFIKIKKAGPNKKLRSIPNKMPFKTMLTVIPMIRR